MTEETYSILDAIRDEIETLNKLEIVSEKHGRHLLAANYRILRRSHLRILNRFEKGYEYYMGVDKEGNPQLHYRQGTSHLEREYPAVAKAKRNLDTVTNIVRGDK